MNNASFHLSAQQQQHGLLPLSGRHHPHHQLHPLMFPGGLNNNIASNNHSNHSSSPPNNSATTRQTAAATAADSFAAAMQQQLGGGNNASPPSQLQQQQQLQSMNFSQQARDLLQFGSMMSQQPGGFPAAAAYMNGFSGLPMLPMGFGLFPGHPHHHHHLFGGAKSPGLMNGMMPGFFNNFTMTKGNVLPYSSNGQNDFHYDSSVQ